MAQEYAAALSVGSALQKDFLNAFEGTTSLVNDLGSAIEILRNKFENGPSLKNRKTIQGKASPASIAPCGKGYASPSKRARPGSAVTKTKQAPGTALETVMGTATSVQSALAHVSEVAGDFNLPSTFETVITDVGNGLERLKTGADIAGSVLGNSRDAFEDTRKGMAQLKEGLGALNPKGKGKGKKGDSVKARQIPGTVLAGIGGAATSFQSALAHVSAVATNFNLPPTFETTVTGVSNGLARLKTGADIAGSVWSKSTNAFDATRKGMAQLKEGIAALNPKGKGKKSTSKEGTAALNPKGKGKKSTSKKTKQTPGTAVEGITGAATQFQTALGQINQVGLILGLPPQFQTTVSGISTGLETIKSGIGVASGAWETMNGAMGFAKDTMKSLRGGLTFVTTHLQAFNVTTLVTIVRTRALAIGGSIKAFGSMLLGFAGQIIPVAMGGLRALSMAVISNPIGLIIAGIALAAGLLIRYWKPLGEFFSNLFSGIVTMAEGAFGWIFPQIELIGTLWKTVKGWFGKSDKVMAGPTIETSPPRAKPGGALALKYRPKPARPPVPIKRAGLATAPAMNGSTGTRRGADGPVTIHVHASNCQSAAQVADEVMRRFERERGRRLHD